MKLLIFDVNKNRDLERWSYVVVLSISKVERGELIETPPLLYLELQVGEQILKIDKQKCQTSRDKKIKVHRSLER